MSARLAHVDSKIKRAEQHIRDLHAAIDSFRKADPYKVITEDHPDERVFRLRVLKRMPSTEWALSIGDALHNLRSCLDVLIWQLISHIKPERPGRWAKYPFAESAKKFEDSENLRKIQRVSADAATLIKATKPYDGGNDALWVLHSLDVADKHHLLLPVALGNTKLVLNVGGQFVQTPFGQAAAVEDGAILIRFQGDRDCYMNVNAQFSLQVTFGEGQVVEGQPVLPILFQLARAVKGVIEPFRVLFR